MKKYVRKDVAMRPSRAQGAFLRAFEERYPKSNQQLEEDVTATWAERPDLAPSRGPRKKGKGPPRFSKSMYHSWRRQDSSPTVHDLEILCLVTGERQTLIVDPAASTDTQDDDMGWREEAEDLLGRMANLSEKARGAVLARLEDSIEKEFAKATPRNPQASDAPIGPRGVRRK